MTLTDQIPGLAAAIEQERHVRETAFLALPEIVCGFEVPPLTLTHVIALSVVRNPFVAGGSITPTDIAEVLVALTRPTGWQRRKLLRRLRRMNYAQAVHEVSGYFDEAFQDAPAGSSNPEGTVYYSNAAALVDVFAREYGWNAHLTLRLPLKQLFQYLKAMQRSRDPRAVMFNPSDKVRGQWLVERNRN